MLGFVDRGGSLEPSFGVKAALGFMLGLGAVSLQMFSYALASVPFSFMLIAMPWAAVTAYLVITKRTAVFAGARGRGANGGAGAVEIVAALVIAPWTIYKAVNRVPGEYEGSIGAATFVKNLGRLPVILKYMRFKMFEETALYNFTWYAYVVSAVFNWRRFLSRPVLAVNIIIFMQILAYLFIYVVTFLDLKFHLETSFDRLAMQLVPVAMFAAAVNLKRLFQGGAPRKTDEAA